MVPPPPKPEPRLGMGDIPPRRTVTEDETGSIQRELQSRYGQFLGAAQRFGYEVKVTVPAKMLDGDVILDSPDVDYPEVVIARPVKR